MLIHETDQFQLHQYQVGQLQTNCYFLVTPAANQGQVDEVLIIDPGAEGDLLSEEILRLQLQPTAIWLTHGHFDHVGGILPLKLNFNLPIGLSSADQKIYQNAAQSAHHWGAGEAFDPPPQVDFDLTTIKIKDWQIIPTPGHTPGSCCFYHPQFQLLFSGDTLFAADIGRTDFQYSDTAAMATSLKKIFQIIPEDTFLLPGHEEISAIAAQKPNLPHFLSQLL